MPPSNPTIDTPAPAAKPVRYTKAREWTKLIAITGSAQIAVQAIGFACGILVIRVLGKKRGRTSVKTLVGPRLDLPSESVLTSSQRLALVVVAT